MFALTVTAVLVRFTTTAASESLPAKAFFSKPIVLGAHRGGRALWPENTLEAFRNASTRWPDVVCETDAHLTADNEVVLLHDDFVDRTTNGRGPVAAMTLAEVKKLDAGFHFTTDDGKTFPYRGKGVTIPTLAEVMAALPNTRFLIELKNQAGVAEAVIQVLRTAGALDLVALASFNPALMARAHAIEPSVARCYDILEGVALLGQLRGADWAAYQPVAEILAVPEELLAKFQIVPAEIQAIRKKGIPVLVETINETAHMKKFLADGIACLLTDRPDLLAELLKQESEVRSQKLE